MKKIANNVITWVIISAIGISVTTVLVSRDLKAKVSVHDTRIQKLEAGSTIERQLLCKIALAVNAIKNGKDKDLSKACPSLIGI